MTGAPGGLETTVGRLLTWATYASIALIALGVAVMLAQGRSPLEATAGLDLPALPAGILAIRPEALLWLGLLAVIFTPAARVIVALVGFAGAGERRMAVVAALVLVVIVLGVLLAQPQEA
jgi:uncharacterized membrane protein